MNDVGRLHIGDPADVGRQAATHQFGDGLAEAAPGVVRKAGRDPVQVFWKFDGSSHACIVMR